ncbi:MAG TPA: hypothetical protein VG778_03195 [Blastocatellia bacterium]|jgi:hypothetical protein|nr:hypothetical protein [Blastocatellia bacterium]
MPTATQETKLKAAAAKVSTAKPKTSKALISLVETVVLPILAPALGAILAERGPAKLKRYLLPVRDTLIAAYPLED